MNRTVRIYAALLLLLSASAGAKDSKDPKDSKAKQNTEVTVKYPKEYRHWTHTRSMLISSDKHPLFNAFGGIHHIYMNDLALKAARTHGPYADGSIIVFDLLEANEADGAYSEGARKLIAVMQKDAKRFKDTGGWGFEGFKGGQADQRLVTDAGAQCFNCHASQKDTDFVYSHYRE